PKDIWVKEWTEAHDAVVNLDYKQYRALVGKTFEELEEENVQIRKDNLPIEKELNDIYLQINDKRRQIRELLGDNLQANDEESDENDNTILRLEKEISELEKSSEKKMNDEWKKGKFCVWGSELRDGKILAELYNIRIVTYYSDESG